MKRLAIVLIVIIVTGTAGYLVWRYFAASTTLTPIESAGGSLPDGNAPPVAAQPKGEFTAVSTRAVFDYWIEEASSEVYYAAEDGQIFKISAEGEEKNLVSQTIPDLGSITASLDGKMAVVSFGAPNALIFSLWDSADASWQPLPAGTVSAAFDPSGGRLAYMEDKGAASSVNLLDLKTKKASLLLSLAQKGLWLDWAYPEKIFFAEKPSAEVASSLWSLDVKKKLLSPVIKDENGLMVVWAKDADLGLKFTSLKYGGALTLINKNGQTLKATPFPLTLPTKCFFEETTLYCAAPYEAPGNVVLPDDYYKRKFYSKDGIISWDSDSGKTTRLLDDPGIIIDADKLEKHGDKIYFINRYDNKLYSLEIAK